MDINEQNQPDSPAVPEQPAADGSLGQAEPQPAPEAPAGELAPVACRIPEVEAPIEHEPAEERRGFIKFLCVAIGGLVSALPFGAGIWAYLNPLTREKSSSGDGFIRVTTLDAIPANGIPAKFSVIADKEDAWNKFKGISIGAVYLRKVDGKVKDAVEMMHRLGRSDRARQSFIRHLFRYFMGRNEMLSDSKTLIEAEKAYLDNGGSFKALVVSILSSDSFLYRR